MFRRDVKTVDDIVLMCLRQNGLETPLKQRQLVDSWGEIAGVIAERYTEQVFVKNQTLFVKITSPALRSELSMMKTELIGRLNKHVGSQIIVDIRFY